MPASPAISPQTVRCLRPCVSMFVSRAWHALIVAGVLLSCAESSHAADVAKWHRFELAFTDPVANYAESDQSPNPFLDRRLTCAFTSPTGAETYDVQGFFNADDSGGTSGNVFLCRFSPNVEGTWTYTASFREGSDVALSLSTIAGVERNVAEPKAGTFTVGPSSRAAPDFRHTSLGWLRNAGGHLFKHAGSDAHVLKVGLNIGEGFLGYAGFDNTERACPFEPDKPSEVKDYAGHLGDWQPGDPNWSCGDGCSHADPSNAGKEIIGAVNYIAGRGANSKYLLLLNVPDGDTCDTYPYLDPSMSNESKKHFDVSKLEQWGTVFEHMTSKGVMIHAQLGEVEIEVDLDGNERTCSGAIGSCIGPYRKLFYREMVARFAHNPAVLWNIGEENGYSDDARRDFIGHLHAIDPYDHPVTSHTKIKSSGTNTNVEDHYVPLLGNGDFDATSIQMSATDGAWTGIRNEVLRWRADSAAAGRPWVVAVDEVSRGADYNNELESNEARKRHQWQTLMAGGHYEWYLTLDNTVPPHAGWSEHGLDPWINDFRLVDDMLRWSGVARSIFARVPSLKDLEPVDTNTVIDATGSSDTWTLADAGVAYLAYDRQGGTFTFDGAPGSYTIEFFDPDTGVACPGTPSVVSGGSPRSLGSCSCCNDDDAVVLVVREGLGPTTTTTTTTSTTTTMPPALCSPVPQSQCASAGPGRSVLVVKQSTNAARAKLKWAWKRGDATAVSDFGDVFSASTSYRFCLYDSSPRSQPLLESPIATAWICGATTCWAPIGPVASPRGYKYSDKSAGLGNARRVVLKAGEQGNASVIFRLKGAEAASFALPLQASVTAQIVRVDGATTSCWETPYIDLQLATESKLKAKGP